MAGDNMGQVGSRLAFIPPASAEPLELFGSLAERLETGQMIIGRAVVEEVPVEPEIGRPYLRPIIDEFTVHRLGDTVTALAVRTSYDAGVFYKNTKLLEGAFTIQDGQVATAESIHFSPSNPLNSAGVIQGVHHVAEGPEEMSDAQTRALRDVSLDILTGLTELRLVTHPEPGFLGGDPITPIMRMHELSRYSRDYVEQTEVDTAANLPRKHVIGAKAS